MDNKLIFNKRARPVVNEETGKSMVKLMGEGLMM